MKSTAELLQRYREIGLAQARAWLHDEWTICDEEQDIEGRKRCRAVMDALRSYAIYQRAAYRQDTEPTNS